jgi:hypothetical protein
MSESIALPPSRLCIAITGHRESNAAFAANRSVIEATLAQLFAIADSATQAAASHIAATRLYSLLAEGADMIAVEQALALGWDVAAPLPFGLELTIAINVEPDGADKMRAVAERITLFELAEQDGEVAELRDATLAAPDDAVARQHYHTVVAERVATAGRILIEQSDVLIAIWDGYTPGATGGTRHTIAAALGAGTPVIWIDASNPTYIFCLRLPEELFALDGLQPMLPDDIAPLFQSMIDAPESDQEVRAGRFHTERWHVRSYRRFHAYRRIEALFGAKGLRGRMGGLVQHYESPEAIAAGSGADILATAESLPGAAPGFADRIRDDILRRFAWADSISTYLSDAYRGGMVANFLLSAAAIIVGIAYLPFASVDTKWPFALAEFLLLVSILAITAIGRRKRWHGRWFETRRVAEYFRHAPILLLLGVSRAVGRWPRGTETEWPEYYVRQVLRDVGLPPVAISQSYLRDALQKLLLDHASAQRRYHEAKAARLTRVHHGLDRLSEWLFGLAVITVATYLTLVILEVLQVIPAAFVNSVSKSFTFLGVILPALGGAFAGIRYFGDFERFAAISEVTAEKLGDVEHRIETLLAVADGQLRYAQVADLAHDIDEIVVSEIESWQSVFGGKQIAVPV